MAVIGLLAGVLAFTALDSDGYRAAEMNLDDASVWVTGSNVALGDDSVAQIGKVNTETPEIESALSPTGGAEIFQSGTSVLYSAGGRLSEVDTRTGEVGESRRLPQNGARVAMGGDTAAILDTGKGSLWIDRPAPLMAQAADAQAPARVEPESLLVVSAEGSAIAYRPGSTKVHVVERNGATESMAIPVAVGQKDDTSSAIDSASASETIQLSAVGSRPALLDTRRNVVAVGADDPVTLPSDTSGVALQQPGPDADRVVVATDTGLVGISDGQFRRIEPTGPAAEDGIPAGAANAARPAVAGGCVFGAWTLDSGVQLVRVCSSKSDVSTTIPFGGTLAADHPLVFRVNNQRAVLNDTVSGTSWYIDQDGTVRRIDNWADANEKNKPDKSDRTDIRDPKPKLDCKEGADTPLSAQPQQFGARNGSPTLVPVFADSSKFTSPSCSVLAISNASARNGTVDVVGSGDTLQYTPNDTATADTITYVISDGRSEQPVEATIDMTIHRADGQGNQAPDTRSDVRATSVVAGQIVSYNVLPGSIDPEGDALALVDACVGTGGTGCLAVPPSDRPTAEGTVQHQSDGWLRYDAPAGISGVRTVAFAVQDQFGEVSQGTVSVRIKSPTDRSVLAVPHDDHVRLAAATGSRFDPTANDVSPNGRPLVVSEVSLVAAPAGVPTDITENALTVESNSNIVSVSESLPKGSFVYRYLLADGGTPVPGFIRVDVIDKAAGQPVAVRDVAVLHGKQPLQVDLTTNDIDPAGGILVVQSIENPGEDGNGPQVQLMPDNRTARITAPDGFEPGEAPVLVRYAVSNGLKNDTGVIVIRPFPGSTPQSPFPQPDGPVTVRPGQLISIPVVENDISPQGGPLRVVGVQGVGAGRGSAFIGNNKIRFVAPTGPDAPGLSTFQYVVEDDAHNKSSGRVTVQVLDPKQPDQAPRSFALEARTFVGKTIDIPVPLLSADPEGQVVGIAAISQRPAAGEVEVTAEGLRYTAGPDAERDVGTHEVRFILTDGGKNYSESVVRIGVAPLPFDSAAPAVTPIPVTVGVGQRRVIAVLDPLYVSSSSDVQLMTKGRQAPVPPRAGTGTIEVAPDGEGIVYVAPESLGGQDALSTSFQYTVVDGNGRQKMNRVLITVRPQAEEVEPIARDDFVLPTRAGSEVEVAMLANDMDPNTGDTSGLKVELVSGSGAPGDIRVTDGTATFEMPSTSVRFRYKLSNPSTKRSAVGVVSVPINLGVDCKNVRFDVEANAQATVDVLDGCAGPPGSKVVLVGASVNSRVGTASIKDQKLVFKAADISSGTYPISVRVCIEGPACPNTTTTVLAVATVVGANDPPTIAAATIHVPAGEGTTANLRPYLSDPNPGDVPKIRFTPATFSLVGGRASATLDALGNVIVKADSDAYQDGRGRDTFEVKFSDGHKLGEGSGTVNLVVDRTNAPAVVANDDIASVIVGKQVAFNIPVLDNDTNPTPDGKGRLEVASVTQPASGLAGTAGTAAVSSDTTGVTFTPSATFGGTTSFTYVARDPSDDTRTARATVSVSVVGYPGLAGTPTGDGQRSREIPLRWGAADGNGGQVDQYEIQCQMETGGGCPSSVPARVSGTSVTVTGLTNGVGYRFRVRAVNQAGPSRAGTQDGWSGWSGSIRPDAVPVMTALEVGDFTGSNPDGPSTPDGVGGQLTIRWNASVDGSAITEYLVTLNGVTKPIVAGTSDFNNRSTTWTGLSNGSTVVVTVVARNAAGDSAPLSRSGNPMGPPAGAVVVATNPGDQTVEVVWRWSPASGEAAPSNFRIRVSTGAVYNTPANIRPDGTYAANIDTPNGLGVRFQVKGQNYAGWGPYGPLSNPTKAVGNPGAPGGVIKTTDVSGHIALTVTAPASDGGDPVTHYWLRVGGKEVKVTAPSSGSTVQVPGFDNGVTLSNARLSACNNYQGQERCGAEANLGGSATPFAPPAAPGGFTTTVSGNKITWTWAAVPMPPGANNVRYRVSGSGMTPHNQNGVSVTTADLGCAGGTFTISVQASSSREGLDQQGPAGTSELTLPNTCPPELDLGLGSSTPDATGGCVALCRTVVADFTYFPPGTYTIKCKLPTNTYLSDGTNDIVTTLTVGTNPSGSINTNCAATPGTTLALEAVGPVTVTSPNRILT